METYPLIAGPAGFSAVQQGARNLGNSIEHQEQHRQEQAAIHDSLCVCTCEVCDHAYKPNECGSVCAMVCGVVVVIIAVVLAIGLKKLVFDA